MTERVSWVSGAAGEAAVSRTVAVLDAGELVAAPSDTVYGLLARSDRGEAWRRLRAVKGREDRFLALVADLDGARACGVIGDGLAARLARVWPGPVTVIVPALSSVSPRFGPTVALRCPRFAFLEEVLRGAGVPLLSTSANLPGQPPPLDASGLGPVLDHVSLVVDGGPAPTPRPSTIVDLTGPLPRLVREGSGDAGALLDPGGPPL